MKVLTNTLNLEIERWDDPGDYPSGAGSGPLPSHDFVAEVSGEVVMEFVASDLDVEADQSIEDLLGDDPGKVDHGISGLKVKKWGLRRLKVTEVGDCATLTVEEIEAEAPDNREED